MPVTFFPFSFLATLSTLLLPEITEAHSAEQARRRWNIWSTRVMLITLVLSFLAGGLFSASLQRRSAWCCTRARRSVFISSILGPRDALYVYGEHGGRHPERAGGAALLLSLYSVCDSVAAHRCWCYLLLPRFGMQGFLFVMLVSNLLTSLLNLHRLLHVTGLRVQWLRWVIKPVFSFLCAGAACRFVLQPLTQRLGLPLLAWAVLGAVFTSVIYALFIWLTGCAGPGDFIVRRTRKKAGERDSSV